MLPRCTCHKSVRPQGRGDRRESYRPNAQNVDSFQGSLPSVHAIRLVICPRQVHPCTCGAAVSVRGTLPAFDVARLAHLQSLHMVADIASMHAAGCACCTCGSGQLAAQCLNPNQLNDIRVGVKVFRCILCAQLDNGAGHIFDHARCAPAVLKV